MGERLNYPSSKLNVFTIPGNGTGREFGLAYPPEQTLTPDPANLDLSRLIGEQLQSNKRLRVLEPGIGSGVVPVTLIWQHPGLIAEIVGTDMSQQALEVADYNLRRAIRLSGQPIAVDLQEGEWLRNVYGEFDLIIFNPPFFTPEVIPPARCLPNPYEAMFTPSLTHYYDQVLSRLAEHLKTGTLLIIRTPRHDYKAGQIRATAAKYLNLSLFRSMDVRVPEGRFMFLTAG